MARRKDKMIRQTARRGKWSSRWESNTQHERMEMTHGMWCAHAKLTTWALSQACACLINEKMWRVRCAVHTPRRLRQTAASCKRSDYNKNKSCKVSILSNFVKKLHNGSHRSICCSFTSSDVVDFYKNSWAPPGIVPLPPRCAGWRRRRVPFLVLPGRNRCESLFSRLTVKTVQFC